MPGGPRRTYLWGLRVPAVPVSLALVTAPGWRVDLSRSSAWAADFWRSHRAVAEPLAIFLATRAALAFVVWVGLLLLPLRPAPGAWLALAGQPFLDGWVRWDSGWHLVVAQQGYRYDPGDPASTPTVLPLFPLLVRLASLALRDLPTSGLIVANLTFAAAVVLLYRLLERRLGPELAARATLLLCLSPFAFLLGAAYPESLALLLAVATFTLLEAGQLVAASMLAALAALASPVGLALWPAVVAWHLERRCSRPDSGSAPGHTCHSQRAAAREESVAPASNTAGGTDSSLALGMTRRCPGASWDWLALALTPIAVGGFAVYLRRVVGEPVGLVQDTLLGVTHYSLLRDGLGWLGPALSGQDGSTVALAAGLLLGAAWLAAAGPAARQLGVPYAVFTLAAVLLPALAGADALGRSLVVAFPAFVVLARYCRAPLVESLVAVAFPLFLGLFAVLFAGWYLVDHASAEISPRRDLMARVVPSAGRQPAPSARPLDLELPNELLVLGYDLPTGRAVPGETIPVTVDLQTLRPTTARHVISVHLNDRTGRTWAVADQSLGDSAWARGLAAGDVTRVRLALAIGPDTPSGVYTPELLLLRFPSFERLPLVDPKNGREGRATLGEVAVLRPEDAPEPGSLRAQRGADATLGGQIALRGFDLSSSAVRPGEELAVALYWQAVAAPAGDYTVFVQLLDEEGRLVAQSDAYPIEGRYPTSRWRAGEVVRDVHRVGVPPTVRGRALRLIAGMYRLETMERLAAVDGSGRPIGDHVALGAVSVEGR